MLFVSCILSSFQPYNPPSFAKNFNTPVYRYINPVYTSEIRLFVSNAIAFTMAMYLIKQPNI